jgi:hypothetical protein
MEANKQQAFTLFEPSLEGRRRGDRGFVAGGSARRERRIVAIRGTEIEVVTHISGHPEGIVVTSAA